jgi:hypothetical protein
MIKPDITNDTTSELPQVVKQDDSNDTGNVSTTGWGGAGNSTKDNSWLKLAYGGKSVVTAPDIEYRLQRLERGQKVVRTGRVITTVPQFKAQAFISQTSANNPFVANASGAANFPPGKFPDQVRPSTANSEIRYPRDVTNL